MLVKIKDGLVIDIDEVKIAYVKEVVEDCFNVVISYKDSKKNPDTYMECKSQEEGNEIVDKIIEKLNDSKKVKFYSW